MPFVNDAPAGKIHNPADRSMAARQAGRSIPAG